MFTVCPGCTRQFQILAEHLAAASGQVRCGFCHEQFNAMDRLYDEPLSNERILNEQLAFDSEIEEEPQFNLSDIDEPKITNTNINADISITKNKVETNHELETAISEIGIRPSVEEIKSKIKNELSKEKEEVEQSSVPEDKPVLNTHYEFPEEELDLPGASHASRWAWVLPFFWTMASIVALLVIIGQLAWFNRDQLLLKYPELIPYAKVICKELDCELIRQRDLKAIKLVNRDVRLHPDYQDTLLVNAAMKNELPIRQPYPRVQLTLFDTAGSLLGHREFVPDDYLDSSIEIDKGMPVDSPVYFVLEVSGPTAGAVSFEFRFL